MIFLPSETPEGLYLDNGQGEERKLLPDGTSHPIAYLRLILTLGHQIT